MQRTRLNQLVEVSGDRISQFFINPWRRLSLQIIAFLFGFFVGQAVSTTAGQDAQWDVVIAFFLVLFTEAISRWVYGRQRTTANNLQTEQSLLMDISNKFKVGFAYGLYLEALKLGS